MIITIREGNIFNPCLIKEVSHTVATALSTVTFVLLPCGRICEGSTSCSGPVLVGKRSWIGDDDGGGSGDGGGRLVHWRREEPAVDAVEHPARS